MQQTKSTFMLVMSVLAILSAIIGMGILGVVLILLGENGMDALRAFDSSTRLVDAFYIACITSVLALLAGIVGSASWKNQKRMTACIVLGVLWIVLFITIIGMVIYFYDDIATQSKEFYFDIHNGITESIPSASLQSLYTFYTSDIGEFVNNFFDTGKTILTVALGVAIFPSLMYFLAAVLFKLKKSPSVSQEQYNPQAMSNSGAAYQNNSQNQYRSQYDPNAYARQNNWNQNMNDGPHQNGNAYQYGNQNVNMSQNWNQNAWNQNGNQPVNRNNWNMNPSADQNNLNQTNAQDMNGNGWNETQNAEQDMNASMDWQRTFMQDPNDGKNN